MTNTIAMIQMNTTDPNTSKVSENNSTQSKVTCFPKTIIKRETAQRSKSAEDLEFMYEKKVEI